MNRKIFLSLFSTLIFWVIFSYSLVFAWPLLNLESSYALSNNIILGDDFLWENKIVIKSNDKAEDFQFLWECMASSKLLKTDWSTHLFSVKVNDNSCNKDKIEVMFKTSYKTLKYEFKLIKPYNLYNKYLDFSNNDLNRNLSQIKSEISAISLDNVNDPENKYKNNRKIEELKYFEKFFSDIIEKRNQKYLVPLKWIKAPSRETKVPNSRRPYRSWYTDWIHHWWDFDAKKWTSILSIDDWIVIRVVNWFSPSDFWKLKRTWDITEKDRLVNLDVLRWNQVWIKTMKWDVIFYSHLEDIFTNIKEWILIKRWQPIWTIWATWVPEEWYSDFHLHMAIQKNPLITANAWKYSFVDIMAWPWSFKWKTAKYSLENFHNIFE